MAEGIGGYLYDREIKDGSVSFHFYDPEDTANTADTTVSEKDYPEGVTHAEARQVVDLAFLKVQKQLEDKRDARIKKEAADQLNKQMDDAAAAREGANDFLANSKEIGDTGQSQGETKNTSNPDGSVSDDTTGGKKK